MTRLFTAKPFIIAEIGSNWETLDDALFAIREAANAGADAVKFQLYTSEALYGEPFQARHELDASWLPRLAACATENKVEFICSAFSPELVKVVDPFVSVHKIASAEAAWPQMLFAVRETKKPAVISLGAKSDLDIDCIRNFMGTHPTVYMHCVAAYPSQEGLPLATFEGNEGLSDHTLGTQAAIEASIHGALAIEKHVTANPLLATPDRPHSVTMETFRRMTAIIRGHPVLSEEFDMHMRHNRRLISLGATRGDVMRYGGNFGAYRSRVDAIPCLSPFAWPDVDGKRAARDIPKGQALTAEDFE